jgi:hypothetical protein
MDHKKLITVCTLTAGLLGPATAMASAHCDVGEPLDVGLYCRFIRDSKEVDADFSGMVIGHWFIVDPNDAAYSGMVIPGTPSEVADAALLTPVLLPSDYSGPGSAEGGAERWYYPWSVDMGVVLLFNRGSHQAFGIIPVGFDTPTCN